MKSHQQNRQKMSKVTTKQGDGGKTLVRQGIRLSKASIEIEAIGMFDELQVALGGLNSYYSDPQINRFITKVQRRTFSFVSSLFKGETTALSNKDITELEEFQIKLEQSMAIPADWVLTTPDNFACQYARITCRKTERAVVKFMDEFGTNPNNARLQVYLNRLSDFLWVSGFFIYKGTPELL